MAVKSISALDMKKKPYYQRTANKLSLLTWFKNLINVKR